MTLSTIRTLSGPRWSAQLYCLTLFFSAYGGSPCHAAQTGNEGLVRDQVIEVKSARAVAAKRRELVKFLWGEPGFPTRRFPDVVQRDVVSPVDHLTNLARVDEFRVALAPGLEGLAYHFVPAKPNGRLVIVHHGHACTFNDDPAPRDVGYGLQRTIHALLRRGYGVVGVYMPRMRPGDCGGGHDAMFSMVTKGNPMRFFVETTLASLNYVATKHRSGRFPKYREFHMTGLSGGGWTTTLYAALDPRMGRSVPIAGTLPQFLRYGGSVGDREQFDSEFYRRVSYLDLYVMGAHGKSRSQLQILIRRDDCCFGEGQHDAARAGVSYDEALRAYEGKVRDVVEGAGPGRFRLHIDESAPSHMISHEAIERLLGELESPRGASM